MREETPTQIYANASPRELKDFQQGHIWRDIEAYLKDRLEGSLNQLKKVEDHNFIMRLQGAIEVAEDILDLPQRMIEWAEEETTLTEK